MCFHNTRRLGSPQKKVCSIGAFSFPTLSNGVAPLPCRWDNISEVLKDAETLPEMKKQEHEFVACWSVSCQWLWLCWDPKGKGKTLTGCKCTCEEQPWWCYKSTHQLLPGNWSAAGGLRGAQAHCKNLSFPLGNAFFKILILLSHCWWLYVCGFSRPKCCRQREQEHGSEWEVVIKGRGLRLTLLFSKSSFVLVWMTWLITAAATTVWKNCVAREWVFPSCSKKGAELEPTYDRKLEQKLGWFEYFSTLSL